MVHHVVILGVVLPCIIMVYQMVLPYPKNHVVYHGNYYGNTIAYFWLGILAYADDPVLLSPSWAAMQHLLNILAVHASSLDILRQSTTVTVYTDRFIGPSYRSSAK